MTADLSTLPMQLHGLSHYKGFAIVQFDPNNEKHRAAVGRLAYDEVVFDRLRRIVFVGERRHFMYVIEMRILNETARLQARARLAKFAEKFGVAPEGEGV